MAIPFRYYLPTIATLIKHACALLNKHEVKIRQIVADNAPSHLSDFDTAFTQVQSACSVFLSIWHILDPNSTP